jgi:nitrous oxidase accessory protein
MMKRWLWISGLVAIGCLAVAAFTPQSEIQNQKSEIKNEAAFDLQAAIANAQPGDVIDVPAGKYAGPLTIDKSLTLVGHDQPIVSGDKTGTVITINAADVTISGFVVENSGIEPDQNHSAIFANKSPRTILRDNEIRQALFGIYLADSPDSTIQNNIVYGNTQLDMGRRGDGLRLWESGGTLIEGNQVLEARDVVLWYSKDLIIRNNVMRGGRYGIHFMYCQSAHIESNIFTDNSVGIFLMYSDNLVIKHNIFEHNRGPSGYGLGFKDNDGAVVEENLFLDNRVGIFIDNSPLTPDATGLFAHNALSYNDIGIAFLPSTRGNTFTNNTFGENQEQVAIQGGGTIHGNQWSLNGRGNYWNDYAERGYDADGDGVGDVAYESDRLFESLMDTESSLRYFTYSPAVQAIEFAARTFPIARPVPKLKDDYPLMTPPTDPSTFLSQPDRTVTGVPLWLASLSLSAVALSVVVSAGLRRTRIGVSSSAGIDHAAGERLQTAAISVEHLTKRFGKHAVLKDLAFEVKTGEALALWGPNGAGKTTLIKSLLGVHNFDGQITLAGFDMKRQGRRARQLIGYVPQEFAFVDLSARAALTFYARLKRVGADRVETLLTQVGLHDHADKLLSALSGGMKQRLALAAALLADPPILILDEPTANLDAQARTDFLKLVADLRAAGKTIIFSSHRTDEVEVLADRVLMLKDGVSEGLFSLADWRTRSGGAISLKIEIEAARLPVTIEQLKSIGLTAQIDHEA